MAALSAALLTFTSMGTLAAHAATSENYTVQPGDTLYKIAVQEGVSLSDLEAANPQLSDFASIFPGELIHLPASTVPTSAPAPATAPSPSAASTPAAVYTVQSGDTLYKIATAAGVTLSALEAVNPQISNFTSIYPGETVYLPAGASVSTASSTTSATTAVTIPSTAATATAVTAVSSTSAKAAAIIATAKSLLGVPYLWGGNTPAGFDCSGFVQYVFAKNGITLPRESHDQATVGTPVAESDLQPGDLLFFSNTDADASLYANHVTHVGIYIGNGAMIESSSSHNGEGVVIIQNVFANPYYVSHYYGARNVM
ncbi:MAG: C40 family peptidase [Alicyclobacillus sp.]|nr:C40 family peptidase [Alicyclobacillus sp.]